MVVTQDHSVSSVGCSVALALDDVGLAVPLQELLESRGHRVLWSPPLLDGPHALPAGTMVDVLVLAERAGDAFGSGIDVWRDQDSPPGILAVVTSEQGRQAAEAVRAPLVWSTAQPAEIADAIHRALALRFSGRLAANFARGHLGLPPQGDVVADAAHIVRAARTRADLEVVREALRYDALCYVSTTALIDQLREVRALEIPEVDSLRLMDGTLTAQSVVRKAPVGPAQAGRLLWALVSTGAAVLTKEPPDLSTEGRAAIVMTRAHLRARTARQASATFYDVLELAPSADDHAIDDACRKMAIRYSPDRLGRLDLGDAAPLVDPIWQAILKARAVLRDPAERLRYNEALGQRRGTIESYWVFGPNDAVRGEEAFARGQRALLAGEPFKAVSEMAAAARAHGDHPAYEATLAWARFRADVARGKPREESIRTERKVAEQFVFGRRPWPRALLALALLCAADADSDAARWFLREALACDPNLPSARQLLERLGR